MRRWRRSLPPRAGRRPSADRACAPTRRRRAHFAAELPPLAERLMAAFWPGPLTVIVPRAPASARPRPAARTASACAAPRTRWRARCSRPPRARACPASPAPSANRFGRVSPTRAAHVVDEFGDAVPVLDGGACRDRHRVDHRRCTRGVPVLLRPGHARPRRSIEAALRRARCCARGDGAAPRASGTLRGALRAERQGAPDGRRHAAPRARRARRGRR